ncbi:hypothetical protein DY000_02040511 [Brassica cretica]|uniref:RRM domain-containing protein n=1 Tax=Brassica cretica TaxID=69181 RepID=A0ABQ7BN78_BRACR|nr:hypothetical protein DY000_02040511 [Brassica cretica]
MAVPENAGGKVDSSGQNLDNNNTASSAAETKPSCVDDQSPKSDSSLCSSTNETAGKGRNPNGEREKSGGCLKSEIKNLADAFSKLNPMAKEFVPPYLATSQSGVLRNGFAVQPVLADGNDHLPRRLLESRDVIEECAKLLCGMDIKFRNSCLFTEKELWSREEKNEQKSQLGSEGRCHQENCLCLPHRSTGKTCKGIHSITTASLLTCLVSRLPRRTLQVYLLIVDRIKKVVDCRVCGDPNSLLRFAFVEFTNEEGARAALSMSGTVLGFYPYPLKVLPSKTAIAPVNPTFLPRSEDERAMCMRTVYCTNIDKRISQTDLKGFFEMFCGEVHRLRLGDYHHHSRIAFVEFSNAESAIRALNCSGIFLGALPIR